MLTMFSSTLNIVNLFVNPKDFIKERFLLSLARLLLKEGITLTKTIMSFSFSLISFLIFLKENILTLLFALKYAMNLLPLLTPRQEKLFPKKSVKE